MGTPRRATIAKKFGNLDLEIQTSFEFFPDLFSNFPSDVSLSYLFPKIELAQHNTIYCGIVKLHKVNHQIARIAVNNWHITRPGFKEKYKIIFENEIDEDIAQRLEHAEKTRDRLLHGKKVADGTMRQAIYDIFEYADGLSAMVRSHAGFTPFGKLSGFKGRAKPHDKSTSRWILKGMGFAV